MRACVRECVSTRAPGSVFACARAYDPARVMRRGECELTVEMDLTCHTKRARNHHTDFPSPDASSQTRDRSGRPIVERGLRKSVDRRSRNQTKDM